ncbi:MAG: tetraacyldisaccharide 4'-kinase [Terriglobales bacterium]
MNPFAAIVKARNALYDRGMIPVEHLQWPVISIGNISLGGSGKTPFTIMLGEQLQVRKLAFDILSRGYKRESSGVKLVEPSGSAAEFGDEPLLMAEKLCVPVIVGEDRAAAGRFAEKTFTDAGLRPAHGDAWYHLLDDGFQHRRLARAFDIVLVNPGDLDDRLLPLGRLREPIAALARADAIVIPESMNAEKLAVFGKPIWRVRRSLAIDSAKLPGRPIAVCGIAKPERFLDDLHQAGIKTAAHAIFPDHHAYTVANVAHLRRLREQHQSEGFITTEKDAINLRPHLARLEPVVALPLKMELLEADAAITAMLAAIKQKL